jgi:hypothetical protein
MSNRRKIKTTRHAVTVLGDQVAVTPAMIEAWRADPSTVPDEWAELVASHGGFPSPVPSHVPLTDQVPPPEEHVVDLDVDALPSPDEDPDAQLLWAIEQAAYRADAAEAAVAALVAHARGAGMAWRTIAPALGVSFQSAQRRYGP